jgi:hypothetical protein
VTAISEVTKQVVGSSNLINAGVCNGIALNYGMIWDSGN